MYIGSKCILAWISQNYENEFLFRPHQYAKKDLQHSYNCVNGLQAHQRPASACAIALLKRSLSLRPHTNTYVLHCDEPHGILLFSNAKSFRMLQSKSDMSTKVLNVLVVGMLTGFVVTSEVVGPATTSCPDNKKHVLSMRC